MPLTAHATKTVADAPPAATSLNAPLTALVASSAATSPMTSTAAPPRDVTRPSECDDDVTARSALDHGGRSWVLTGKNVPEGWLERLRRGDR